eukprot:771475_1
MGALFALFNTNELKNFELNWKDIEKSHPQDASLYAECRKMLQICNEISNSIDNYEGAKEEIKLAMNAIQNSDEQKQAIRKAMIKVIPNAALCQSWMQFCTRLSKFLVKRLLPRLSVPIMNGNNNNNNDDDDNDDDDDDDGPIDDIGNYNENEEQQDIIDEDDEK